MASTGNAAPISLAARNGHISAFAAALQNHSAQLLWPSNCFAASSGFDALPR